jgi:ribosomal protein S18 acetylase RimI-like enzyme
MSHQGRFGKYGEIRRLERLRQAGTKGPPPLHPEIRELKREASFRKEAHQKSPVRIRQGAGPDVFFIEDLSRKVFHVYGPYDETIPRWFQAQATITLVAVMNRRPVGFAMAGRLPEGACDHSGLELLAIAVEPQEQRLGIGEMLTKEIEKALLRLKVRRWFLHTAKDNLPARRLFTRCGYLVCGLREGFYPSGQDALLMMRDLAEGNPV